MFCKELPMFQNNRLLRREICILQELNPEITFSPSEQLAVVANKLSPNLWKENHHSRI